jgi:hypothetical protein
MPILVVVADQPGDQIELCQQRRNALSGIARDERGGIDGIQGPLAHGVEDETHIGAHADRDDQDGARRAGHDAARGLDAVHTRHEQIHEDQVGRILRAEVDGSRAVARDPDDVVVRVRCQHASEGLDRHGHVVDDADSHAPASPIRSTTACSSVSSWKLPFVR